MNAAQKNYEDTTVCHSFQVSSLEAWHITSAHTPLNHIDGGLLPDTYLHLINKNERWLVNA